MTSKENIVLNALRIGIKTISTRLNIPAYLTINEVSILLNKNPANIKQNIGEGLFRARGKTLKNYVPIIDLRDVFELL